MTEVMKYFKNSQSAKRLSVAYFCLQGFRNISPGKQNQWPLGSTWLCGEQDQNGEMDGCPPAGLRLLRIRCSVCVYSGILCVSTLAYCDHECVWEDYLGFCLEQLWMHQGYLSKRPNDLGQFLSAPELVMGIFL